MAQRRETRKQQKAMGFETNSALQASTDTASRWLKWANVSMSQWDEALMH